MEFDGNDITQYIYIYLIYRPTFIIDLSREVNHELMGKSCG